VPPEDDGEVEGEVESGGPSRRAVLRAGALGVAAWSVPTIRPIARTAAPGSKPPTTEPTSSSVLASETSQSEPPNVPGYTPPEVDNLDVAGPAKPVDGEPGFTG
jgi:hypothetical protein